MKKHLHEIYKIYFLLSLFIFSIAYAQEEAIIKGINWLISQQSSEGWWSKSLDLQTTAFSILSLEKLGLDVGSDIDHLAGKNYTTSFELAFQYLGTKNTSIYAKLQSLQKTNGSWDDSIFITSIVLIALSETGNSNPDAIAYLKSTQDSQTGSWQNSVYLTSISLIALLKSGDTSQVSSGINYLIRTQQPDGSWDQNLVNTSLSLLALYLYGGQEQIITKGINFIISSKNPDNGWPIIKGKKSSPYATSIVLYGLSYYGRDVQGLQEAINYLYANKNNDLCWYDDNLAIRDTAETLLTFLTLGITDSFISKGLNWLYNKIPRNTYETSLKILSLAKYNIQQDFTFLFSLQNADGGFGVSEGFLSQTDDTISALRTINSVDITKSSTTVDYILSIQNNDGGWGIKKGEGSDIYLTAFTLIILKEYQDRLGSSDTRVLSAIKNGSNWLLAQKNSDNGWGKPTSTVLESSISYSALSRINPGLVSSYTINFIISKQSPDGDWEKDVYTTNLAIRAIYDFLNPPVPSPPDLVITQNDITFTKSSPEPGTPLVINAVIHNTGEQVARNVLVQFYDGNPDTGGKQINGDITIPNIYGGSKAEINLTCTLEYGRHDIYVKIDPYNTITESDETNNVAFNTYIETNEALPDLSIMPNDITFSNSNPKAGEEFTITAIIKNLGGTDAKNVVVQFYNGEPNTGEVLGSPFIIPDIPISSYVTLNLKLCLDEGLHNIFVVADPTNTIAELNETNNKAGKIISISSGPKTDLSISSEDISFSISNPKAGDLITTKAVIHNTSQLDAKDIIVKFYDGDPKSGGVQIGKDLYISSIPKGSTATIEISFSLSFGIHKIYICIDPYNTIAEEDETNNIAYYQINVSEAPLPDVCIGNITYQPEEPKSGQSVKLSISVKNIGSGIAKNVKARLYQGLPEAGGYPVSMDLIISFIEPSSTEIINIGWVAEIGDHTLVVVLDPENEIAEIDKSNNRSSINIHVIEGPPLPPPTPPEVQAAIDKGISWLKSQQKEDGSIYSAFWPLGETCLAIMALLQGGVPRTDPVIQKALEYIEDIPPSYGETYEIALKILAFQATGDKTKYFDKVQSLTNTLITQYWLGGPFMYGDMSNTQYGVLALYAGEQWGIEIPQNIKDGIISYVSGCQNSDGGWGYGLWGSSSYGSMTAAGIMDLRILGVPIEDSRIQKGISWLNSHYSVTSNPGFGAAWWWWGGSDLTWHYYYLYSLERAMEIPTTIKLIGTHDWYQDGCSFLINAQQPDGRWTNPYESGFWYPGPVDVLTTSWALLFLEKAIPVKPFIDLEITPDKIKFSPTNPSQGNSVTISAEITNKGTEDAYNILVRFYDGDPRAGGRQIGQDQIIPEIKAGCLNIVSISHIFTSDGIHSIYVFIDPLNLIEEKTKENNIAYQDLLVLTDFSGTIDVKTDKTEYNAEENVNIEVYITINQFVQEVRNIIAEIIIEDSNKNIVYKFNPIPVIDFQTGQSKEYILKWNTGDTIAGDYKVHGILKVGDVVKAEDYCQFRIISPPVNLGVSSEVATDKLSYNPNEDVKIISKVVSKAKNYTYTDLIVREVITNPTNEIVSTQEKTILSLLPQQDITLNFYWNTGSNIPGTYTVNQTLLTSSGETVDIKTTTFKIESTLETGKGLSGTINADPEIVKQPTFDIITTITNNGNVDLTQVIAEKLIIDPDTKQIIRSYQETISLLKGETKTSVVTGIPASGLSVKDYLLILNAILAGKKYPLSSGHVKIVDIQPPRTDIEVGQPKYIAETIYVTSSTEFTLTAVDDLIEIGDGIGLGVNYTEYKIGEGEWMKYTSPFTIGKEGRDTIYYRSVDIVGNIEAIKTLNICVDNTPPLINIISPVDGKEYFNNEAIQLKVEVNDIYSGVKWYKVYLDGNEITGQNIITAQVGSHKLKVIASDNLSHISEKEITFTIKLLATIRIEPETFNKNTGEFTAFVILPDGYDASTIRNAVCDGAPGIKYNYSPGKNEMIIKFRREDVTEKPLDTHFVVRGIFGDNFIFEGWDDIMKIVE